MGMTPGSTSRIGRSSRVTTGDAAIDEGRDMTGEADLTRKNGLRPNCRRSSVSRARAARQPPTRQGGRLGRSREFVGSQVRKCREQIGRASAGLEELAIGGTATGTGLNAPPGFGAAVAAPLIRDTITFLYDKPKAIAALHTFEQGIGGPLEERATRKTAMWRAANGLPPLPATQA